MQIHANPDWMFYKIVGIWYNICSCKNNAAYQFQGLDRATPADDVPADEHHCALTGITD